MSAALLLCALIAAAPAKAPPKKKLAAPAAPVAPAVAPPVAPSSQVEAVPPPARPPMSIGPRIVLAPVSAEGATAGLLAVMLEQAFESELRALEGASVQSSSALRDRLGVERARQLFGAAEGATSPASLEADDIVWVRLFTRGDDVVVKARRNDGAWGERTAPSKNTAAVSRAARELVGELFPGATRTPTTAPQPVAVEPRSDRPIRVAVLAVRTNGDVPRRAVAVLDQALTPELRKLQGVSAIGSTEIADMLTVERQRQMLGCSSDSSECMAEVAGALDADELMTFDLTLVGDTFTLSARRTDLKAAKVVQSQVKQFERRDGEELLDVLGPTVAALYPERPLKSGRLRGVEPELIRRLNPPPLPRWVFVATTLVAAVSAGVGATFGLLTLDAQQQHDRLARSAMDMVVGAGQLDSLAATGRERATFANGFFIASGGLVVIAAIEALFTDWRGDRAALP